MPSTIGKVSDEQLDRVLTAIKNKPGMTLKELEKELKSRGQFNSSMDLGAIVSVLDERHAVLIRDDQTLTWSAFYYAKPPLPQKYSPSLCKREERRHKEPMWSTDPRDRFVRDRERIIFSSAFRRLAGVTQVFPAKAAAHNRMIHSVKAGHIARSMVQLLGADKNGDITTSNGEKIININVVEAAALAHDIGHPPFGHAGEKELNECMKNHGGFEGNAQTFRVLTKLSRIRPEFPGLNLTRATLNAVIKYPWFRGKGPNPEKWNAYSTEADDFDFARQLHSGLDKSPEAKIMEWSDDIAYGAHDLEDGVRKGGLIPIHQLVLSEGPEYDELLKHLEDKFITGKSPNLFQSRDQLVLALGIFGLGGSSLKEPFKGTTDQRGQLRRLTTLLHQRYLLGVSVSGPDLSLSPELERELKVLKEIMGFFVFKKLIDDQQGYRKQIKELFGYFVTEGIKKPKIFDPIVRASRAEDEKICSFDDALYRAAADQIANMTEDELENRPRKELD